jgi:uncharacterized protein YwgA
MTQPPLSKNQQVLHLLAKLCGRRLGRTRLTKALFLADYHSRIHRGAPITSYEYKFFHYGPWTGQIQEDVVGLEALGVLQEKTYIGWKGSGHYYLPKAPVDYGHLDPEDVFILEAVVDRCSTGDLEELLTEVYSTPPMEWARKMGRGVRIPMEMFDGDDYEGPTRKSLERAERELDRGLGRDLNSAWNGLHARHFADS